MGSIILRGNFGESMAYNTSVAELLGERFLLTITISITQTCGVLRTNFQNWLLTQLS